MAFDAMNGLKISLQNVFDLEEGSSNPNWLVLGVVRRDTMPNATAVEPHGTAWPSAGADHGTAHAGMHLATAIHPTSPQLNSCSLMSQCARSTKIDRLLLLR